MKHLRLYEARKYSYKVGDYIVLLEPDGSDINDGFIEGGIYKITLIDSGEFFKYRVENSHEYTLLSKNQFRKATDEEVAMVKYNL